eukprot:TRINITY_DN5427_c0_g3_i3.p1 TRINITY_DN5427_c0_g3~~TRINITY_DN5427_c0_g3_i3.p1  ORF type:complete len:221 (+),score=-2.99 TRINITY_DN5427_c0_g3_i3:717-1379(+)
MSILGALVNFLSSDFLIGDVWSTILNTSRRSIFINHRFKKVDVKIQSSFPTNFNKAWLQKFQLSHLDLPYLSVSFQNQHVFIQFCLQTPQKNYVKTQKQIGTPQIVKSDSKQTKFCLKAHKFTSTPWIVKSESKQAAKAKVNHQSLDKRAYASIYKSVYLYMHVSVLIENAITVLIKTKKKQNKQPLYTPWKQYNYYNSIKKEIIILVTGQKRKYLNNVK